MAAVAPIGRYPKFGDTAFGNRLIAVTHKISLAAEDIEMDEVARVVGESLGITGLRELNKLLCFRS